jgi:hypothetical protein
MTVPSSSASNERTPLLVDAEETGTTTYDEIATVKHDVYDRFAPSKKRTIIAIVSFSGLIPCVWLFILSFHLHSIAHAHFIKLTASCPYTRSVRVWLVHSQYSADRERSELYGPSDKVRLPLRLSPTWFTYLWSLTPIFATVLRLACRFSQCRYPVSYGQHILDIVSLVHY